MAKTKEELNELKKEYEALNNKLKELEEDEVNLIIGGGTYDSPTIDENDRFIGIWPTPKPIKPIVSVKCQHKPCAFASKDQCPYYNDNIGDCDFD